MREQQPGVERVDRRFGERRRRCVVDREHHAGLICELAGEAHEPCGPVETEHTPRPARLGRRSRVVWPGPQPRSTTMGAPPGIDDASSVREVASNTLATAASRRAGQVTVAEGVARRHPTSLDDDQVVVHRRGSTVNGAVAGLTACGLALSA